MERYTLISPDHIQYDVTIEDPKVFTRPWNMSMILYRHKEKNVQLFDYECYGFDLEKYYPYPEMRVAAMRTTSCVVAACHGSARVGWDGAAFGGQEAWKGGVERLPDGQPNVQGFWTAEVGGTYDLTDPRGGEIPSVEQVDLAKPGHRAATESKPDCRSARRPDPYQPWAAAKQKQQRRLRRNPTKPEHIDTQNRCLLIRSADACIHYFTAYQDSFRCPGSPWFLSETPITLRG